MPNPPGSGQPPDPRDDVVRGHSAGFVNDHQPGLGHSGPVCPAAATPLPRQAAAPAAAASRRRHGCSSSGSFEWAERPLGGALRAAAQALPVAGPDYLSEINLAAPALVRSLAQTLRRGLILLIDYGFPQAEYYHPDRSTGTLMCHYRHRAFDDPFYLPGLVDITAHVDFTSVADAALAAGLEVMGYADQAHFLINCGLLDGLAGREPASVAYLRQAAAVQKLVQPSEMGELFKAVGLTRGIETPLAGFAHGDRRHAL